MRLLLTAVIIVICCSLCLASGVPGIVNYQGKLLGPNGTPVADGTRQLSFSIYDSAKGGTSIWSETQPSVASLGGVFSVMLGSVTPFPADIWSGSDRWLGVKMGTDPEMTPRQQIASGPFAFRAASAATVDDGAITSAKLDQSLRNDISSPVGMFGKCISTNFWSVPDQFDRLRNISI